jgi:hypothetical protein
VSVGCAFEIFLYNSTARSVARRLQQNRQRNTKGAVLHRRNLFPLLQWGRQMGAQNAYLQVREQNEDKRAPVTRWTWPSLLATLPVAMRT